MKMFFVILCFSLLVLSGTYASTLTVHVINNATNQPIGGATLIRSNPMGGPWGPSDASGTIVVPNNEEGTYYIIHPSYSNWTPASRTITFSPDLPAPDDEITFYTSLTITHELTIHARDVTTFEEIYGAIVLFRGVPLGTTPFFIDNFEPGLYTVSHPDYDQWLPQSVTLVPSLPNLNIPFYGIPIPNRTSVHVLSQIESISEDQVRLDWSPVPGVISYKVFGADEPLDVDSYEWAELTSTTTDTYYLYDSIESRQFFHVKAVIPSIPIMGSMVSVEGGTIYPTGGMYTGGLTVSSFSIDRYEVTQASYQYVMDINPAAEYGVGDIYPVYNVSWFDAIEYCNRGSILDNLAPCYTYLNYGSDPDDWPTGWNGSDANFGNISCNWTANGYRLPTDMEWEYAARGGLQTQNSLFSGSMNLNSVGWYRINSLGTTHPVGQLMANELGLKDMSGNVFEWCGNLVGGELTVRGGCFDTDNGYCTVWYPYSAQPSANWYVLGFRVCRSGL